MRAIKNVGINLKNNFYKKAPTIGLNPREILINEKLLWISIFILLVSVENVWAVGTDSLSQGVTTAETILTGSMMRLIVIAGSIFGVIKAYMASSPLLMGGSIAIGIGINLLMTWVKATWPILI